MKYMGSKNRHAKELLPIILKDRKPNQWYVEPFVGGANMIDKVDGNRIGGDFNPYVIDALESIRDNIEELPKNNKEFTEDMYRKLRNSNDYKFKGYVGFTASYGGKWLGGWSRTCAKAKKQRDYIAESYRNAIKQSPLLQGIRFISCGYKDLLIPNDSIVYCDPPYANTTKYSNGFNHAEFWEWVRETSKNNTVFVSEYNAPDDFECVWEKKVNSSLTKNTGGKKNIERLFKLKVDNNTYNQV